MARKFHRKRPLDAVSEINVTPLIDLAFALLIIFMITTPLLEQSIDINLPEESQRETAPDPERFRVVSIDADGSVYWVDQSVDLDRLGERLDEALAESPEVTLVIRADRDVRWQAVVDVLNVANRHGLDRIHFDTRVR